jgi:hypothetical protein
MSIRDLLNEVIDAIRLGQSEPKDVNVTNYGHITISVHPADMAAWARRIGATKVIALPHDDGTACVQAHNADRTRTVIASAAALPGYTVTQGLTELPLDVLNHLGGDQ